MTVRIYLPNDFIIRHGDMDDKFYMINRGICELVTDPGSLECGAECFVITPDHGSVRSKRDTDDASPSKSSTSLPRSITCEANVQRPQQDSSSSHTQDAHIKRELYPGQAFGELALFMNYERTATVRAITHVEMCELSRDDFQQILARYPQDRERILSLMLGLTSTTDAVLDDNNLWTKIVQTLAADKIQDSNIPGKIIIQHSKAIISDLINPTLEDPSIKFGVKNDLKRRLHALRDQLTGSDNRDGFNSVVDSTETAVAMTVIEQQLKQIEATQRKAMKLISKFHSSP
ncbi:TPA: hypothetical protein N0F65_001690 [Lagenidium giganteum]|uniref:Cyclic nucleotide-binding domain-containing protein n=1 Tax=Lagenidium giganteum TaxID=4803 RepID=A0AAV2YMR5_9STRA|nr:TPA: hypothetical protein N0F65_001690 [Lagenidium giganteum]